MKRVARFFEKAALMFTWVFILAMTGCGSNNSNQNYTPNQACMQANGLTSGCQGYNQYGSGFSNYPMNGSGYNYSAGCGNGAAAVYGNNTGLGCFNSSQYPGNYAQYTWTSNGLVTMISCTPNAYSNGYYGTNSQCPQGYRCVPVNNMQGMCSQ